MRKIVFFSVYLILFFSGYGAAQVLEGKILDKESGEPVPAARIFFSNTQKGTFSDDEGYEIFRGRINSSGEFEVLKQIMNYNEIIKNKDSITYELDLKHLIKVANTNRKSDKHNVNRNPLALMTRAGDHEINQYDTDDYSDIDNYQTSYIFGLKSRVKLNPKGILKRPEQIKTYGFWAEQGIADLLPYDFNPEEINQ